MGLAALHPMAVAVPAHGAMPQVRRVRPDDAPMIDAFVQQLSLASRQRRFHAAIRALPEEWLQRMTHPDAERELALVATVRVNGVEHCVGEARYALTPDEPHHREFALVVADGWQGRGIGRSMLRGLDRHAARHGVSCLYGDVLRDNLPMIELARCLGYRVVRHPAEARLVRVQRVLRTRPALAVLPGPAIATARPLQSGAGFI
jgi:RimJ/RimL family protein N-acetyltransferase